jgi:NAD(P) transhydrogenase
MQAVKHGKNVAVIERFDMIGGGLHALGDDPQQGSAVFDLSNDRGESEPAISCGGGFAADLVSRTAPHGPQRRRAAGRHAAGYYDRNRVPVIARCVRFVDTHTVEVTESNKGRQRFTADYFVIATGSRYRDSWEQTAVDDRSDRDG